MALTPDQTTLYTQRLADAEQAYHDLRLGNTARVFVDQNGERVEYAPSTAAGLRAYILELKSALGLDMGIIGPMGAWTVGGRAK